MTPPTEKTPWLIILVLIGAGILSAFQVGKVPPLIPDIRAELGLDLVSAGWVLSIFNIIGLMLGIWAGAIADTLGHRRLLIYGLFFQSVGSLAGSFAPSFGLLLMTRFIEGAGFLAVIVSTPTLIFQAVNLKDSKIALSMWTCYLPAGSCLVMLFIPAVIQVNGWRGVWQINGLIMLLYIFIVVKITSGIPPFRRETRLNPADVIKDIITTATSVGPLLLTLIFVAYAFQWLAVMGFLPTLLFEKYHFSKSTASLLTAIVVGVNIIGNLSGGWFLKIGAKRWMLIAGAGTVMGCCAFIIYSADSSFAVNYAGCILFSLIGGLIPAAVIGAAPLYAPTPKLISTTTGMIIQGGQSGQVFGPTLLAMLVSASGTWESGSWFLAGIAATGVFFSLLVSRFDHKG